MIITVVRHTSVDLCKDLCYGITDVPVAPSFPEELKLIGEGLEGEGFDVVFSSPLQRCLRLAGNLARGAEVITDSRLTELDFGDWEMADWDSIFESPNGKAWFADYIHVSCPNGESFAGLTERTASFLSDLRKMNDQRILVVTHAGVIRALICLVEGKTPEEAFGSPVGYGEIFHFHLNSYER